MKYCAYGLADIAGGGRAPYGARGLKYAGCHGLAGVLESRPVWGAWIEMVLIRPSLAFTRVAPRMGRVD